MQQKLAIIVPYRDRDKHLKQFIPAMELGNFLEGIDFEILVVEQEVGKSFNRGILLNIGADLAQDADYYCFHDVDMLPVISDYSPVSGPTHLAAEAEQFGYKLPYPKYFGGVTLFDKYSFSRINGYSNNYWGWGAEDDDVMYRCLAKNISTTRRVGRFRSLPHEVKIIQEEKSENLRKYIDFKNGINLETITKKIDSDGLSTMNYEVLEVIKISDKTSLVKVRV